MKKMFLSKSARPVRIPEVYDCLHIIVVLSVPPATTFSSFSPSHLAFNLLTLTLLLPIQVNERLTEMDIKLMDGALGSKDYSVVKDGDVVILPAFGATIQEMQFLDAK
jgi:hypothetical protein